MRSKVISNTTMGVGSGVFMVAMIAGLIVMIALDVATDASSLQISAGMMSFVLIGTFGTMTLISHADPKQNRSNTPPSYRHTRRSRLLGRVAFDMITYGSVTLGLVMGWAAITDIGIVIVMLYGFVHLSGSVALLLISMWFIEPIEAENKEGST